MAKIIAQRGIKNATVQSNLDRIKHNIQDSYQYFSKNYKRFNEFTKFVYETSLSPSQIDVLNETGKPVIEFNISEAYVSRQLGEFSKQEPSVMVSACDDADKIDPALIKFLDGHFRAILYDANTTNMSYETYKDCMVGGFSAIKVYTDYTHEMSFDQNIYWRRCFHPTLCGWDKMARESHKGDGMFCFEIFPMCREEFEEEHGTELTEKMKFDYCPKSDNNLEGFSWSYRTDNNDMILVADYYEKKKSKIEIVQLLDGQIMTTKEYERFLQEWNEDFNKIQQAPGLIGKPRKTTITTICRYRIVENQIIEYVETDYKCLPIIFVDGNSVMLREGLTGSSYQLTRPYLYHAKGIQTLKNFAGITLANELENMVQHKIMACKEGIPADYKDAYINFQKASVMIYNGFKDDNPNIALPPPTPVVRVPAPPEVMNTFTVTDEMTQHILGSYDASLGINNNQLSGVAIQEGATQSNATGMPFIVGYLQAINRASDITLDLIPKYLNNPRSLPTRDMNGKTTYSRVNEPGAVSLNFKPESFHVKVEAGVNYEIQRTRALNTLVELMKVSPPFNAFMAGEEGLQALLDNIDIRGIDGIKQGVAKFVKQMEAKQEHQHQMEMQMNPMLLKQQELKVKEQKNQMDMQISSARVAVEKQSADTDSMIAMAQIGQMTDQTTLQKDKIDAENARTAVEGTVKMADAQHRHAMEILGLHHEKDKFNRDMEHKKEQSEKMNVNNPI